MAEPSETWIDKNIELAAQLDAANAEIGALRRELERIQPHLCNKYLEDNLCGKPLGHEGDCEWFPF